MKLTISSLIAIAATAFSLQTPTVQTPAGPIKVRGCLQGNGSDQSPWSLRSVVLPSPPVPAAAGARGGRGDGGARGAGAGGRGRGEPPAAATPAPPPQPPQPPVDLRLTGVDMSPWRNMFVEVEGTLGPRPASGLREFQVTFAHSAYGDCR